MRDTHSTTGPAATKWSAGTGDRQARAAGGLAGVQRGFRLFVKTTPTSKQTLGATPHSPPAETPFGTQLLGSYKTENRKEHKGDRTETTAAESHHRRPPSTHTQHVRACTSGNSCGSTTCCHPCSPAAAAAVCLESALGLTVKLIALTPHLHTHRQTQAHRKNRSANGHAGHNKEPGTAALILQLASVVLVFMKLTSPALQHPPPLAPLSVPLVLMPPFHSPSILSSTSMYSCLSRSSCSSLASQ